MLLLLIATTAGAAGEYRYDGAERIVAMSDPHGAYDAMLQTLGHAGIVDSDGNWAGGTTYLVITGDMLDRGADSRAIMDLVMRLESEATAAGGKVLLTLGNHEVMNLVGDLRYVSKGEFAAFADEEQAEDREHWFRIFVERRRVQTGGEVDEAGLQKEFDRTRPPGFYGHRRAFSSAGRYGRWLLGKPLVVVVNGTAFVHGGMPPLVAELGLDELNGLLGADVNDYVLAMEKLQAANLIDPAVNFYDHGDIAQGILTPMAMDASADPAVVQALETVVRLNNVPVHSPEGPLWYRGTVGCSVLAEGDIIAASLTAVGAARVVIGHTPTVTRRVLERFDGRVIEIDTGILKAAYGGSGFALVMEGDDVSVVEQNSDKRSKPVQHPRRVGERVDSLSTEALEDLLRNGDVVATETDEAGRTLVEVSKRGARVRALFAESPRRGEPELAAYEIDRMIGLDLVPVTVLREVEGKRGTLTFLPASRELRPGRRRLVPAVAAVELAVRVRCAHRQCRSAAVEHALQHRQLAANVGRPWWRLRYRPRTAALPG